MRKIKVGEASVTYEKRMMVLLLAAAMGMAMAGCQYGGDADAKSEQEETKKEGTKRSEEKSGLAADLFFSAAPTQMSTLDEEGMIDSDSIVSLLENKIVLIIPTSSDASFASFEDIADANTVAIGDPKSVPVGQYSQESLTNLGLWDAVSAKGSFGTNVTEVLNWVAESSADCGIVYATDAATTDRVKVVAEAPADSLKSPVLYPVAMTKEAPNQEATEAFYEFILSDDAMTIFESYGFTDYRSAE